jgi:hypothetical protein
MEDALLWVPTSSSYSIAAVCLWRTWLKLGVRMLPLYLHN